MKIERDFEVEIMGEKYTVNIINEDDIMAYYKCDITLDNGELSPQLSGSVKWDGIMRFDTENTMDFGYIKHIEGLKILLELIYTECKNTFQEGTFNL